MVTGDTEAGGRTWWEFTKGLHKVPYRTYWTKEGRRIDNLPADPWNMRRYLARGFTLEPPKQTQTEE